MRVDFEFTAADVVKLEMQQLATSKEAASWRRREQAIFVASLAGTVVLMFAVTSGIKPLATFGWVVAGAIVAGLVLVVPFTWYYDDRIRTRTHRYVREQLGGEGPYPCSIELRPEHLWARQQGVELLFPWSDATSVLDDPDGVVIVFENNRVLAKIASPEQRHEFRETAHALAASANGVQPR